MSAETPAAAADDWMNLRRVNPVFRAFVSPIASCWLVYGYAYVTTLMLQYTRAETLLPGQKTASEPNGIEEGGERSSMRPTEIPDVLQSRSVVYKSTIFCKPSKQTSVGSRPFQIAHPFRGHRKVIRFETIAFDDQVEQFFLRRVAIDGFFQYPEQFEEFGSELTGP